MRIFKVLIITTTTVLLLLLWCLPITSAIEFIPSCETGTFLVCHFFADQDSSSPPIELCVAEDALVSHFQFYPNDTQGSCPANLVDPTTACPLECDTSCSLACQNLINGSSTTPNENMDCFDCQGTPGYPGSDAAADGIQCWDKNENHACDLITEDQNKDDKCTLKDCQAANGTTATGGDECLCTEPIKLCCYVSLFGTNPPTSNPSPILGQIRWIAWNDCQRDLQGHAPCQGQLMAATQNSALFTLMHTKYGGDGVVTFALPNFQNMKI